ncbi:hypothetical protein RIF29_19094 [Crotalaria pallida]|uniref:Uncharacterized protein n=1 Tax=Crotalaria pallida TaxID=3830 RepID=A0AAN9F165_CROPI
MSISELCTLHYPFFLSFEILFESGYILYSGPSKDARTYLNWLRVEKRSRWPAKLSFKLITQLLLLSFEG